MSRSGGYVDYRLSELAVGTPAVFDSKIENDREHASIIATPSGSQSEEFAQLMLSRLGPLWTQRQVLQIVNGQAFEAGDFRVMVGELRRGQEGSQRSRGVIVELEWMTGDESDWSSAEAILVGFRGRASRQRGKRILKIARSWQRIQCDGDGGVKP